MNSRGRTLKFTAVVMFVILALTGFSTGKHRSSRHYGSSHSTSGGDYLQDATVKLISCATRKKPHVTVEVTNPNDTSATFSVTVFYKDKRSKFIDFDDVDVTVPANGKQTAKIPFNKAYFARLDHCEPQRNATVER
ncbi:hypothetical protein [Streptomyces sp. NPDC053069]|uniref:hypothetical protein n=1 Tax=Streptomyces sp. NPDC053069 TaxID=3365695 RepID=UPI0037D2770A